VFVVDVALLNADIVVETVVVVVLVVDKAHFGWDYSCQHFGLATPVVVVEEESSWIFLAKIVVALETKLAKTGQPVGIDGWVANSLAVVVDCLDWTRRKSLAMVSKN